MCKAFASYFRERQKRIDNFWAISNVCIVSEVPQSVLYPKQPIPLYKVPANSRQEIWL